MRLEEVTEDRGRELARLILQVRNAAGKVVLHHMATGITGDVKKFHAVCNETVASLNTEGEIEGGKIKEIVYKFTTFVGFHVTRFLGGIGPIIGSDKATTQQIAMDEYQFCGRMADRADEAIKNIQKVLSSVSPNR
ncbi:hypothetical protein ACFLYG_02105 [Chloroflexota bacterium]